MKVLILIVIGLLVVGCGKHESAKPEAKANSTSSVQEANNNQPKTDPKPKQRTKNPDPPITAITKLIIDPVVEKSVRELPACDPVATAKWATSLYTLKEGKLTFGAGNTNRLHGQISLTANAKVSSGEGGRIIIDQEGFLPVSYGKSAGYETFFFTTPLTHGSPLSLDDFVPYEKDIVVQEDSSMFRKLGEALHLYFTGLATEKPDHHRVEDVLGYPADYYVWDIGGSTVFLKAYQGNDTYGLMLRVCSKATELGRAEITRQRSRISGAKSTTRKEVFRGWGEPLEITND